MKIVISDGVTGQAVAVSLQVWSSVKTVKDVLHEMLDIPPSRQRLFYRGRELKNNHTLMDCNLKRGSKVLLYCKQDSTQQTSIEPYGGLNESREMKHLILQARQGLRCGLKLILADEGNGGTYFLRNRHKERVAVFKPGDEEMNAPNNPRGYQGALGSSLEIRHGNYSGEGYLREVASFLLDHDGFADVPVTGLAELQERAPAKVCDVASDFASLHRRLAHMPTCADVANPRTLLTISSSFASPPSLGLRHHSSQYPLHHKVGSFQEFVRADDTVGNMAARLFPVREVHKIGILDIRLINTDRNEENILVQSSTVSRRRRLRRNWSLRNFRRQMRKRRPPTRDNVLPFPLRHRSGSEQSSEQEPSFPSRQLYDTEHKRAQSQFVGTKEESDLVLVPIDHSFCLPDVLEVSWIDWCWLDWPQCKEPFDEATLRYLDKLDIDADCELMRVRLDIREPCLRLMKITGTFLKMGAKAGLTLYDIASLIVRQDESKPSQLEDLCARAAALARAIQSNVRLRAKKEKTHVPFVPIPLSLSLQRTASTRIFRDAVPRNDGFVLQFAAEERKRKDLDGPFTLTNSGSLGFPALQRHYCSVAVPSQDKFEDESKPPKAAQVDLFFVCLRKLLKQTIRRKLQLRKPLRSTSVEIENPLPSPVASSVASEDLFTFFPAPPPERTISAPSSPLNSPRMATVSTRARTPLLPPLPEPQCAPVRLNFTAAAVPSKQKYVPPHLRRKIVTVSAHS